MQRLWRVLLTGLVSLLSHGSQDHQLRDGTTHQRLGFSPINHQLRRCSAGLPATQSSGGIFSVGVFSSKASLAQGKVSSVHQPIASAWVLWLFRRPRHLGGLYKAVHSCLRKRQVPPVLVNDFREIRGIFHSSVRKLWRPLDLW